jgi:hypothetical protein
VGNTGCSRGSASAAGRDSEGAAQHSNMGAEAAEGRRADPAVVPKGTGHAGNEAEGEGGVEDSKVSGRNALKKMPDKRGSI